MIFLKKTYLGFLAFQMCLFRFIGCIPGCLTISSGKDIPDQMFTTLPMKRRSAIETPPTTTSGGSRRRQEMVDSRSRFQQNDVFRSGNSAR